MSEKGELFKWNKPANLPKYGTTLLQKPALEFFTDAKSNQYIHIFCYVELMGVPQHRYFYKDVHLSKPNSCAVYKITKAYGFEKLIGIQVILHESDIEEIDNE